MTSSAFGKTLQHLLNNKGISVRKCSIDTEIPYKCLCSWVGSGGRVPRNLNHIKILANYFNVSTHFLLFGEAEEKPPETILDRNTIPKNSDDKKLFLEMGQYEILIRKL